MKCIIGIHRVYIHILLFMYKDGQRYRHDVHDLVASLLISKQRGLQWGPSRRMFARWLPCKFLHYVMVRALGFVRIAFNVKGPKSNYIVYCIYIYRVSLSSNLYNMCLQIIYIYTYVYLYLSRNFPVRSCGYLSWISPRLRYWELRRLITQEREGAAWHNWEVLGTSVES